MRNCPWTILIVGFVCLAAPATTAQQPSVAIGATPADAPAAPAAAGYCGSVWFVLGVDPPQPACDSPVTLSLQMWLPDTCWGLAGAPAFHSGEFAFSYDVAAEDSWEPDGPGCTMMVVELPPFQQTVGPLAPGPYVFGAQVEVTSLRHGDSSCFEYEAFDVTCCEELPAKVSGLRLGKTDGELLLLTWDDLDVGQDYFVFADAEAAGEFDWNLGVFPGGAGGAPIVPSPGDEFYLVAARNACGLGPRH